MWIFKYLLELSTPSPFAGTLISLRTSSTLITVSATENEARNSLSRDSRVSTTKKILIL